MNKVVKVKVHKQEFCLCLCLTSFKMNVMKLKFYLFMLILIPITCLAQQSSSFLPQTVIVKVKSQFSPFCNENAINYSSFNVISSALGVSQVKKIFPHHKPEKRDGLVDLSLIYEITYTKNISELEVAKRLKKIGIFLYAEPYVIPELTYTPNDPIIVTDTSKIWHLIKINAFNAWDITKGDTNITVGVTDMGWDNSHPDLMANVKKNYNDPINGIDDDGDGYIDNYVGWDLGNGDNDAQQETSDHGTHVTGLVAAVTDNGIGVASVGFNTKFLPIKIANSAGILTQAYQGVVYAADHGCFIINCSWGSTTPGQFQKDVIDYAIINKGCLVVGACGNNDNEILFYPAAYNGVLTVAASEQADLKASFSNYGYYVDISSPGKTIWSTIGNGSYGSNGGTSMAAPIVSGSAALVKAMHPTYNNQQIAALLRATAADIYPLNPTYLDKLGNGRLDIYNALSAVAPQFVELTATDINDYNNNIYVGGDTLHITGTFTNYLAAISGLTVTISSTSPYVSILDGTTTIPSLISMESYVHGADPFLVEVLNGAPFNEVVVFKMVISNGVYAVNKYVNVTLNPDYINLEENQVKTSITSKGKIGFNDDNNTVGLGFSYNGEQLLYEAGFMIGNNSSQVSDCIRGISVPEHDFGSIKNVTYHPPYVSSKDLIGEMNDNFAASPLNISIKQKSYAFATAPNDKFVIVKYLLKNEGTTNYANLFAGIFADWDISNAMINKADFDATRRMGYVKSIEADSLYAAVKLLSPGTVINYAIDNISGGVGGIDLTDGFNKSEKYTSLSTNRLSAGLPSGQDVAHVVSTGNLTLNAGDSVEVAFAIIAGEGLIDIQTSANAAQTIYDNVIGIDELQNDHDLLVYPNPSKDFIYVKSTKRVDYISLRNIIGEVLIIGNSNKLSTKNLNSGIYFIEITTEDGTLKRKVIIHK